MGKQQYSYELLFIDDGSTDQSWNLIENLASINPNLKAIKFRRNYGKSQALHAGFKQVKGEVVITMDADLQDSPDEIPKLYKMVTKNGYDIVSGWKKIRHDSVLFKNLPSKLFNWAARQISGLKLHDFNCGIKAYQIEVVKNIEVYGEMHRYIPVLATNAGFSNIGETTVTHQARKHGKTKFGMERFINGFLDLITIWFISRFGKRPMHFFGLLGVMMFTLGSIFALYMGIDKLFLNPSGRLIAERTEFFIALTSMIIGSQFFVAGFLGEMILRSNKSKAHYEIEKII
jgi:glycosyltransferase involved in cell wall biosynthesis